LVDFLLKKGAEVNALSKRGDTALHGACAGGNADIVKKLLRRGAEVNVADESGDTPLHEAAFASEDDPKAVELLLSAGADLRPRIQYSGNTPLHQAALRGNLEIAKALVRHGADVDVRNKDGRTTWEEAYRFSRDEDQVKVHDYLKSKSRATSAAR
jgi:ankyrin repeat protein